jgi:hypothetical protein
MGGRENVTSDSVQWHDLGLAELNLWVLPPQYYSLICRHVCNSEDDN